jgi:predicted nucleic acid-binding protein
MDRPVQALSLYLDTSVIGGYFDPEFMADTRALWRLHEEGRFRFVSSQMVIDEIANAPERVRELMRTSFVAENVLDVSVEMEDLAAAYLARKVVPTRFADDAQHVAVCSVARLDYLVSWNFKHLTNMRREAAFNAVNVLQGYPSVRIVAPTFLIHGREEKDL